MNRVKKSLYLCIGVLLILVGVQGMQSLYQFSRLSTAAGDVAASSKLSGDSRNLWAQFQQTDEALKQLTAFMNTDSAEASRKAFDQRAAVLRQQISMIRSAASGELGQEVESIDAKIEAWLALAAQHVSPEGLTELPSYHRLETAHAAVDTEIAGVVKRSADSVTQTVLISQAITRNARLWTIGEMLLAVALGAALGWRALRSLHQQLGADASEVSRVANAVADGDLTVRIATEGLPKDSVMAAFVRMQRSLQETVSRVHAISSSLASGSHEIASGNGDLSQRTEQQAASLERTAATMEELGTTVRNNAEHSTQASQLADQASAVATRGGAVVDEAVQTMRGINDSSRKIADIIGVIDGIAFQTNILALNAAVEAARAGDQGRGFAVVASEVRSLAKRSAEAASEIKSLITASVERVEAGSALIDQAGHTMQEVVQAIDRVTSMMAQIRTASVEQSAGVEQVGQSVAELDRATQQNAALAEQSAAAAESLKAQGQQLTQAMTFFKVNARAEAVA